jgi:hypothetical protein
VASLQLGCSNHPLGQGKVWKDVLRSENNTLNQGRQYLKRVEIWEALEKVFPYLVGFTLNQEQINTFKAKIESRGRLYVKCFRDSLYGTFLTFDWLSLLLLRGVGFTTVMTVAITEVITTVFPFGWYYNLISTVVI